MLPLFLKKNPREPTERAREGRAQGPCPCSPLQRPGVLLPGRVPGCGGRRRRTGGRAEFR